MNRHLRRVSSDGRDGASAAGRGQLRERERRAWSAYLEISRALQPPCPGAATGGFLAARAVPAFSRIGVDETVVQTFFGLASEAWGALDTSFEKVVRLRPQVHRDVNEVRRGLLAQAGRQSALRQRLASLAPQEVYASLQALMDPANLHLMLEETTTPWIVLPRAYSLLHRDDVHYLPAYLTVIDRESNDVVSSIFTRIAVEFLANFSVRFADEGYPRDRVACLVTAAYEALFWRSLGTPPGGTAARIAEHFRAWLRHSGSRSVISASGDRTTGVETEMVWLS